VPDRKWENFNYNVCPNQTLAPAAKTISQLYFTSAYMNVHYEMLELHYSVNQYKFLLW